MHDIHIVLLNTGNGCLAHDTWHKSVCGGASDDCGGTCDYGGGLGRGGQGGGSQSGKDFEHLL